MTNKQYIKNMLKTAGSMMLEPENLLALCMLAELAAFSVFAYNDAFKKSDDKKVNAEKVIKQLNEQSKINQKTLLLNFSKQR